MDELMEELEVDNSAEMLEQCFLISEDVNEKKEIIVSARGYGYYTLADELEVELAAQQRLPL